MGFKEWPSWVKGGVIFLLINVLFLIVLFIIDARCFDDLNCRNSDNVLVNIFSIFLGVSNVIGWLFVFGDGGTDFSRLITIVIISFILSFLVGALIGWIVGKMKSRGEVQYKNV
jgi:hypothetical protein